MDFSFLATLGMTERRGRIIAAIPFYIPLSAHDGRGGRFAGGLSLFAEDAAEDVGDLAYGGVGLDAIEDGGNGVFATDGNCPEALKRGGGGGFVALVTDSLDAGDLLADGLGVDALELLDGRRPRW